MRRRFREPVALTEAAVFALAGAVAGLLGPWKWFALVAAPVIFAVVLVIATWPKRRRPATAERDVASLVRRWAGQVADHDPARAYADNAERLADGIDDLILRCERAIARLDGTARQSAEDSLTAVTDYLARSVDSYTSTRTAPVRAAEWRALADRLKTAYKSLLDELGTP